MAKPPAQHASAAANPSRRRAGWLLTFLGFFLVIGSWSVAAPYNGTPDELHHVLRAVGVATGQVAAAPEAEAVRGGGAYQEVPASLVRFTNCWQHKPWKSAACAPEPGGDETVIKAGTAAGRYHPGYYALVGWPMALSPDMTGVLLARLISAALAAALLANALTDALRWSRFRLTAIGLVTAFTPMAAHLASAVNPSGLEIAAGLSFFAAAIPLLYTPGAQRNRTLLWHLGIAALGLATLRTAGPLWLTVAVVALLVPLQWHRIRQLWQWRGLRWWTLGVVAAGTAAVGWTLLFRTNFAENVRFRQFSPGQAVFAVLDRWTNFTDELVGVTAWLDVALPGPIYRVWQFAVAFLIIGGFVLADRSGRWRLAALFTGGVVLPSIMQVSLINEYGMVTQGRYMLPVLVGLPILGAYLIQRHGFAADRSKVLLRLFLVLLMPIHLISLIFTMVRWQRGLREIPGAGFSSFNPFVGEWQPMLGPVLPLVMSVAGLAILAWRVWPGRGQLPEYADADVAAAVAAESDRPASVVGARQDPHAGAVPDAGRPAEAGTDPVDSDSVASDAAKPGVNGRPVHAADRDELPAAR